MQNAWGIEKEELETCASLQDYDLIWWDGSLREDKQRRQGGHVALHINVQLECMELQLGMHEKPTASLWVRIKERGRTR